MPLFLLIAACTYEPLDPNAPHVLSFSLQSPSSLAELVGSDCKAPPSTHQWATCQVALRLDDGTTFAAVDQVVYGAWSEQGETYVLATQDLEVWVGSLHRDPVRLPGRVHTPALSPDGAVVAGHLLGEGADVFEQLEASPGIAMWDGDDWTVVIDGPRVFAPFFVDRDRLGYGGDADGLASLYVLDLATGISTRLTNVGPDAESSPDPFPIGPPSLPGNGEIQFASLDDDLINGWAVDLETGDLRVVPEPPLPLGRVPSLTLDLE